MTTRREYNAQEIEQVNVAEQQLRAKGLDEGNERVVDVLDGYYQANRAIPVTAEAIVKLLEAQPGLKWLSPAEAEHRRIAAENPAAAQQLADWLAKQGKPGTLVNSGEEFFLNMSLLLIELRGRPVDSQRIHEAMGRIGFKPGRQLHFVPEPRKHDPRQHQSDGTGFLGKEVNEPRWKRISRERSEREANQPDAAAVTSAVVREAKQKAESIAGSTHAETDQLRKLFVTAGTDIDWVQTWASREQMQKQFNKHREVARFIR